MKLSLLRKYVSPYALALGVAGAAFAMPQAYAQNDADEQSAPERIDDEYDEEEEQVSRQERVIVTGSFLAGTPEDAAIPVQVIDLEELQNMGSPDALDLVKTMTAVSGIVAGEANRYNSFAINYSTVNLRGLGANRTLVLLNGKRFAEQYGYGRGRAVNVNQIPMNALARVETLTDGGAATYGSDALGGVVNYITRHDFDGFEIDGDYRYIADSDGEFGLDFLWGNTFDNGDNLLVSAEFSQSSILRARDRDFITLPYIDNPNDQGWNQFGSPGTLAFYPNSRTDTFGRILPSAYFSYILPGYGGSFNNYYQGDYQMGQFGTTRDPGCSALGGFAGFSGSAPRCYFDNDNAATLRDEVTTINTYAEFNSDLTDRIHMRLEAGYYYANVLGATNPSNNFFAGGRLPGSSEHHVPGYNPAVADILQYMNNSDGTPAFTQAQRDAIINNGSVRLAVWTPFATGGHPLYGDSGYHTIETNQGFVSGAIDWDLPEFMGFDLDMKNSLTYFHTLYDQHTEDMRSDRLAAALYGYGGPDCGPNPDGSDPAPGTNGCEFFNPFSSAIASNYYTGQANSLTYNPNLTNSIDLIDWMLVDTWNQRTMNQFTYDLVFSGDTPFKLPGMAENIKMALGGQYRFNRVDDRLADIGNWDVTENVCSVPESEDPVYLPANLSGLLSGCTGNDGALFYYRNNTVLGPTRENTRRYPVSAAFYEFEGEFFDRLTLSTAGRWEKFYSDLSDFNAETFVPAFSGRFQAFDWFAIRGTYGKSFTYVSPNSPRPANVSLSSGTISGLNGEYDIGGDSEPKFFVADYVNSEVEPEKGTNLNVGLLFDFMDGRLTAHLDYFKIEIDDYVREISVSQLFDALTGGDNPSASSLINCDSSLLSNGSAATGGRPTFELYDQCVQGTSTLENAFASLDPNNTGRINYFADNTNGGTYSVDGIDFGARYLWEDFFGGDFTSSIEGTYNLNNGLDDFIFDGTTLAEGFDGVGFTNSSDQHEGIGPIPEWRGNLTFNYNRGNHNFNLGLRYISGLTNDDTPIFEDADYNPNVGDANGYVACTGGASQAYDGDATGSGTGTHGDRVTTGTIYTTVGYCAEDNVFIPQGQELNAHVTADFSWRWQLPGDARLQATIYNLFDTDPEFHRSRFSYNTYLGSPLGRNFKIELSKRF